MYQIIKRLDGGWQILKDGTMVYSIVSLEYRLLASANGEGVVQKLRYTVGSTGESVEEVVTDATVAVDIQTRQFRILASDKDHVAIVMRSESDETTLGLVQAIEVLVKSGQPLFSVSFQIAEVSTKIDGCPPWINVKSDKKSISRYELIKRRDHGQGIADANPEIAG